MQVLPPGNILQNLFLVERLKKINPKSFCEIGSGNGHISRLMLKNGIKGIGYDLNSGACENNKELNKDYIAAGNYKVVNGNFLEESSDEKYDFIISCMVIEHLDEEAVNKYFDTCKSRLTQGGTIAILVPAGMKFWGIEDEIAGHFKRYSFNDFDNIAQRHNLSIAKSSGLTYPISNWLLGLSNALVAKSEGYKKDLSMQEQTVESGNRNVMLKTTFPPYFIIALNKFTMYPFHMLQKWNSKNEDSMVLYCEYKKK